MFPKPTCDFEQSKAHLLYVSAEHLARCNAQPRFFWRGSERKQAIGVRDAEVGIVGAEDVAVDIQIIAEFCEMRGSADQDAGFDHAADHRFEASFAGGLEGFEAAADAAGLDELDIDAVKAFGGFGNIFGEVIGFVAENWQGRALLEPRPIFDGRRRGHRLLNILDVFVSSETLDIFERFFFGFPAFIGINANGQFGCDLAQRGEIVFVVGHADFDLEDREAVGFLNFSAENVGFVDADGEGRDMMIVAKTQAEQIVNRLLGFLPRTIKQSDVDSAFGRHVAVGNGIEVSHAAFDVAKREGARIYLFAKLFNGIDRLLVTRNRRCFAQTYSAISTDQFHNRYRRDVGAFGAGDSPLVGKSQVEPFYV
jgi:hypothetical protein